MFNININTYTCVIKGKLVFFSTQEEAEKAKDFFNLQYSPTKFSVEKVVYESLKEFIEDNLK